MIGRPKPVDVNWGGKVIPRGTQLWPLGTFTLKVDIYARLRGIIDGDPRLHFPVSDLTDRKFFEQLTAEYLAAVEKRNGLVDREWRLLKNRPNEQLDLIVGARAMAAKLGLDRMDPERWAQLREQRGVPEAANDNDFAPATGVAATENAAPQQPAPANDNPPSPARARPSNWLGGRREGWIR